MLAERARRCPFSESSSSFPNEPAACTHLPYKQAAPYWRERLISRVEDHLRAAEERQLLAGLFVRDGRVPDLRGAPAVDEGSLARDGALAFVPRKLLLSSTVVKPEAFSGRVTKQPYPQEVSASATMVAACR